eukprot:325563-Hanusia_phi.AAC.1
MLDYKTISVICDSFRVRIASKSCPFVCFGTSSFSLTYLQLPHGDKSTKKLLLFLLLPSILSLPPVLVRIFTDT